MDTISKQAKQRRGRASRGIDESLYTDPRLKIATLDIPRYSQGRFLSVAERSPFRIMFRLGFPFLVVSPELPLRTAPVFFSVANQNLPGHSIFPLLCRWQTKNFQDALPSLVFVGGKPRFSRTLCLPLSL